MKVVFFLGLVLLIWIQKSSASNDDTSVKSVDGDHRVVLLGLVGRKLKVWWDSYVMQQENKETFVGRCLGVAKKVKQLLPIIVFKLGVIMTVLGFLTLFSVKTLALLVLLLLINTGGAVGKLFAALSLHKGEHDESSKKPQNIHLHIHQSKHGYHVGGSSYGWDDRIDDDSSLEKIESYNMYDKLLRKYY